MFHPYIIRVLPCEVYTLTSGETSIRVIGVRSGCLVREIPSRELVVFADHAKSYGRLVPRLEISRLLPILPNPSDDE